jgi:hypothetical protein
VPLHRSKRGAAREGNKQAVVYKNGDQNATEEYSRETFAQPNFVQPNFNRTSTELQPKFEPDFNRIFA